MLSDTVESKLPTGIALPESIRFLCDYLDLHGYPLSGCFEISTIGDEDIREWFPNDPEMQQNFAVFGRGSTGSTYAIWLREGADAVESPVVVLGSEGDLMVLATNCIQFCRLLGCGYNELEWDDLTKPSTEWDETQPLRDWLTDRLKLDFPMIGAEIVSQAQQRFPDFQSFVQSWWDTNT